MWVDPDELADDLLEELSLALAPPPELTLEPNASELEFLQAAVALGFTGPSSRVVLARRGHGLRRRAWWVSPAAAAVMALSASGAAAASGGLPLPGAVRGVAHALGLPVDSPALDDTHRQLDALEEAVDARDHHRARQIARALRQALARVPGDEQVRARSEVDEALFVAAPLLNDEAGAPEPGGRGDLPAAGSSDRASMPPVRDRTGNPRAMPVASPPGEASASAEAAAPETDDDETTPGLETTPSDDPGPDGSAVAGADASSPSPPVDDLEAPPPDPESVPPVTTWSIPDDEATSAAEATSPEVSDSSGSSLGQDPTDSGPPPDS